MPNEKPLHAKVGRYANDQKQSKIPLPVHKNIRNSKVKLNPISKISQCSSKIIDRDIKKIESVIYEKQQSILPSNLKISKEVTITSINHVNDTENNIILRLKKLPGITIDLVKSEPVFKVPESPKLKTNNIKKNTVPQNKCKVFFEKKGLSERREVNIEAKDNLLSQNDINILNTDLNPSRTLKQKSKQTFNNISLGKKFSDKAISKNPEVSIKKYYPASEKENVQRTSSPKKFLKKIQGSSNIKSKNSKIIKLVEEESNNCKIFTKEIKQEEKVSNNIDIFSKDVKKINDTSDTTINNIKHNTYELENENYMLMDLSTEQFNIVPASFPIEFINGSVPEYDNFLMGISKSSKDCSSLLEISQNDHEKESIIVKEELNNFSDFLGCVNTSLNINESDDIQSELASQFCNNKSPLDNIKEIQLNINNKSKENIIGKFTDEQNRNFNVAQNVYHHTLKQIPLQHYDMNQMMNTSVTQENHELLQKKTSYFCDNSVENIPKSENNLMDYNIPIQKKLPNNIKNLSNLNSDENENCIKRKSSQNDLSLCENLKKHKIS